MGDRADKTGAVNKGEKKSVNKTPETDQIKQKKLVQLNLKSAPSSVRNLVVSDKNPPKKPRTSSSDQTPDGDSDFITTIQDSLAEIKETMVKKSDIKDIVTEIITGLKNELKKEIISEIKKDLTESVTDHVKTEFETKIEKQYKDFNSKTKEIEEGFNMDFESLKEKLHSQARDIRILQNSLKDCQIKSESAIVLSNQNQQYSQKNNIKFVNWAEKANENLRHDLCHILKNAINLDLDPTDILEIHRIPNGNQRGPRPVIAKFRNSESKLKIIRNRSNSEIKKMFTMHDHLTPANAKLIRDLNNDERIQTAWYYNGKVFALDEEGQRYKFDIMDTVSDKLKKR